jgi:hypothetical protein
MNIEIDQYRAFLRQREPQSYGRLDFQPRGYFQHHPSKHFQYCQSHQKSVFSMGSGVSSEMMVQVPAAQNQLHAEICEDGAEFIDEGYTTEMPRR